MANPSDNPNISRAMLALRDVTRASFPGRVNKPRSRRSAGSCCGAETFGLPNMPEIWSLAKYCCEENPMSDDRLRPYRSVLYIPGSNERALGKARDLPADAIIFDLEDAVAAEEKPAARALLAELLATGNDHDFALGAGDFLHDHAVGTTRHHCASHHPDRLTRADLS
jgi:hypothetical protein